MRTERRASSFSSPEIERMNGFQLDIAAKSVSNAQTRLGGALMSIRVSIRCSATLGLHAFR